MILSHRYRFIFIKTRKTAGSTIEATLSPLLAEEDVLTPIRPAIAGHRPRNCRGVFDPLPEALRGGPRAGVDALRDLLRRRRFREHMSAFQLRCRLPEGMWERYFTFCVERDPWDKTLSDFHWRNHKLGRHDSLDDYLARGIRCRNFPLYTDPASGGLMVDRVLRYERLQEEFAEVMDRLGVPGDLRLTRREKGGHRTDRRPYTERLTGAQRRTIAEALAPEIALLGYRWPGTESSDAHH